jgi:parallel beta-helix repeat protein
MIKMRQKGMKILAVSVVLAIFVSSMAIFSTANFGICVEGIDNDGGKGIISLVPPPFVGVAGASGGYVAATNLDTGGCFSSIQAAIDDLDTKEGHTIIVNPGYYLENVNVHKALTIKSAREEPNDVIIIAAKRDDSVIKITANNVSIIGLRTEGTTAPFTAGIHLRNVSHCYIANCFATMNRNGIALESSNNSRIYNNSALLNRYHDIALILSNNNIIEHNNISESEINGIYLEESANNLILNNIQESNHVFGIQLWSSNYNIVTQNRARNNTDNGIYLVDSNNNKVINNTAVENRRHGISLGTSNNNEIRNNTAARNTYSGIGLWDSEGNEIANNLALNNGDNGFFIYNANGNRIIGNNASCNNASGIYLDTSTCEVRQNVANYNLWEGSEAHNSDKSIIEENTCEGNIRVKPDLTVVSMWTKPKYFYCGDQVTVYARVQNKGLRDAPPFRVRIWCQKEFSPVMGKHWKNYHINGLRRGEYINVSLTFRWDTWDSTERKAGACADWDLWHGCEGVGVVEESDESNNEYKTSFQSLYRNWP